MRTDETHGNVLKTDELKKAPPPIKWIRLKEAF